MYRVSLLTNAVVVCIHHSCWYFFCLSVWLLQSFSLSGEAILFFPFFFGIFYFVNAYTCPSKFKFNVYIFTIIDFHHHYHASTILSKFQFVINWSMRKKMARMNTFDEWCSTLVPMWCTKWLPCHWQHIKNVPALEERMPRSFSMPRRGPPTKLISNCLLMSSMSRHWWAKFQIWRKWQLIAAAICPLFPFQDF